jgi:hypothetical protein
MSFVYIVKDAQATRRAIEKVTKDARPGAVIFLEKDEFQALRDNMISMEIPTVDPLRQGTSPVSQVVAQARSSKGGAA